MEDGFRLAAIAGLFAVVAPLSLREEGGLQARCRFGLENAFSRHGRADCKSGSYLSGFVLRYFVLGVAMAVLDLPPFSGFFVKGRGVGGGERPFLGSRSVGFWGR